MSGKRSKTRKKAPVKSKRKRLPKSPNEWRKTRAVGLREVRKVFTFLELEEMGDKARAALTEVREGSGGVVDTSYTFCASGASYKIPATEQALRDFLWRIGEHEVKDG